MEDWNWNLFCTGGRVREFSSNPIKPNSQTHLGWLGSRVVSVLDSGAEGPGSNRSRDAVG